MQYEDIHLSDVQQYALFRQFYTAGDYVSALNLLSSNPQLDLKAIIADNLNTLSEQVYGMENVYYVEVEDYLNNLLNTAQANAEDFISRGEYDPTQQYQVNNHVYYNNNVYFCIKEPPIGTDPTNTEYWLYLGLFGQNGKDSLSNVNFRGQWSQLLTYNVNDCVYIGRTFYWAKQTNSNQSPTVVDSQYWGVLFTVPDSQQVVVSIDDPTATLNTGDFWWKVTQT